MKWSATKTVFGFAALVGLILLLRPITEILFQQKRPPVQSAEDQLSLQRSRIMEPDKVIQLVNPPTGGTVLDLGAGFGMYTFRLGRAVGSAGKVFATDIDSVAITYLSEQVRKEGATNIFPVQVSSHGLDSFYRGHEFDLIFVSDVILLIPSPKHFFDELCNSLKKETGRLWVVTLRTDPDFSDLEFGDAQALYDVLRSPVLKSGFGTRLSASTKETLKAPLTATNSAVFIAMVLADLNKMLADPTLWPQARDEKWPLNTADANLRDTLSDMLGHRGVFASPSKLTESSRGGVRLLNRLIIADLLRSDLWGKVTGLNTVNKQQLKALLAPIEADEASTFWGFPGHPPFLDNSYEMVRDHKTLNYCSVWEFRRKR